MGTYVYDGVVPGCPSRLFGSKLLKIWFVRMSWKWIAHRSHRISILGTLCSTHIMLPVFCWFFLFQESHGKQFLLYITAENILLFWKQKKTFNSFVVFLFLFIFQVTGIFQWFFETYETYKEQRTNGMMVTRYMHMYA